MNTRRVRHDLDHLNSVALLLAAVATIVTGLIVHLWDLHGFVYHTYAGYVMAVLALVHVSLNWRRTVAYTRFRLVRRPRAAGAPAVRRPPHQPEPASRAAMARRLLLSRRGLFGLALGGTAGHLAGRGLQPPPPIQRGEDLGYVYHAWSKPGTIDALGSLANLGRQPPLYKVYPDAPRVALPEPDFAGGLPTEEAIRRRRSTRSYAAGPLRLDELSRVLLLTAGLTADRRRGAPSSGALYPIELYPVIHAVEGVEPGVYHYGVERHELEQVRAGDIRRLVVAHGLSQDFLGQCGAVVYLTMIFQRMRFRYGERSYRYGLIEVGHLGQNLYLAATSLGLGACAVGAYDDDGVNELLGIDGVEEVSVYLLSLGRV